jgi:hypothetical protein
MLLLKIVFLAIFVLSWLGSKKSRLLEPSDFFVPSFVVIYAPGFLFNPSGRTELNGLDLPAAAISNSEWGFMLALLTGAMGFGLRCIIEQRISTVRAVAAKLCSPHLSRVLAIGAATFSLILFALLLLLSPEFRDSRASVLRFFTFQLSSGEYRILRNAGYTTSWFVENLVGRLQFSVFPICFCLLIYPLLQLRYAALTMVVAIAYFLMLPASLSKMPAFFFLGYLTLLVLHRILVVLDIRRLIVLTVAAPALLVALLIVLYLSQYRGMIDTGTINPLRLAIERLWGEPFSIVVRYFAVYPDILPFTGWSGINLLAKAIGLSPRLPHMEVARVLLGPNSGSNPCVFFMGGYAAFGFAGLSVFSFLGVLLLWALDVVGRKIRVVPLKDTYVAVIGMNVMFLNQISLQTALVTYGLALVPTGILLLDRMLVRKGRQGVAVQNGSDSAATGGPPGAANSQ